MVLKRGSTLAIAIFSTLFPALASNCRFNQDDSPILSISTQPKYVIKGENGNITLNCLVQRKVKIGGNPVTKALLWITKVNKTKMENYVQLYNTKLEPYNVSMKIRREAFGNESSLEVHCQGFMNTDSCSLVTTRLTIIDAFPEGNSETKKNRDWLSIATIIGIAVGSATLFIIILVTLLLCHRNRERRKSLAVSLDPIAPPFVESDDEPETTPVYASQTSLQIHDEVFQLRKDILVVVPKDRTVLGNGKFGCVVLGQLKCRESGADSQNVAVKMLKEFENTNHRKDFEEEVMTLTMLEHPNIVKMIGFHATINKFYIVMEYLARGSLLDLLQKEREAIGRQSLIEFARDIACGMEYLAQKMIVHRDLAARNVLIADDGSAKISDFGLARSVEETGHYLPTRGYIPFQWVSPQTLEDQKFTIENDVWSFGVVIWEIFSYGQDPYESLTAPSSRLSVFDLREFLKSGKRLQCPYNCPNGMYILMTDCWSPFPANRPSFSEIKLRIQKFLDSFPLQPSENE